MITPTTPAERLRTAGKLGPYPEAPAETPASEVEPEPTPRERVDTAAVRAWAAEAGIELRDRGPIPSAVLEQYHAREV